MVDAARDDAVEVAWSEVGVELFSERSVGAVITMFVLIGNFFVNL